MGKHTDYTKRWLDLRFAQTAEGGLFYSHQPVYGVGHPACEPHHARRMARTLQMLVALSEIEAESVLDVGGAEGFFASRARDLLGLHAVSADVSPVASARAWDLFGVDALALTSHALPFADDSFDVVTCSEVIEHVEHPVETLFELCRVAKRAVILTTEEFSLSRDALAQRLFERCGYPHHERNLFHPDDLRAVLGASIEMRSQMLGEPPPDTVGVEETRGWVASATEHEGVHPGAIGVQLVAMLDPSARRSAPSVSRAELLDRLMQPALPPEPVAVRPRPQICAGFADAVCCPDCRAPLKDLVCSSCGRDFEPASDAPQVLDGGALIEPSRERSAAMLADAWPADRAAAALDLRDRLDLPMSVEPWRWTFADPEQRRGWLPGPDLVPVEPAVSGKWAFESRSETPWLISPGIGARGERVLAVEIEASLRNADYPVDAGDGQVFWLVEGMADFDHEHRAQFRVINDGASHSYRVELAGHPAWPQGADVVCLRIDIVNGPCSVQLHRVELVTG